MFGYLSITILSGVLQYIPSNSGFNNPRITKSASENPLNYNSWSNSELTQNCLSTVLLTEAL